MPLYPELRRLFVVSTAHLSAETAKTHSHYDENSALWPIPYGFLTWAWNLEENEPNSLPQDLVDVLTHLKTQYNFQDGDYIRFDCDGPVLPHLKTYNW